MQNQPDRLYDIGDLKNDPVRLYDLAVHFSDFYECRTSSGDAELWEVLSRVNESLWGNLPPVVVIDFRDPGDPATWGKFGEPPGLPTTTL